MMDRARPLLSVVAVFALFAAGCGSGDTRSTSGGPDVGLDAAMAVPATRPSGFTAVMLVPAEQASAGQATPSGEFWYSTSNGALEWYLRAQHLAGNRMYRVEITTDESARYAIASVRADASGSIAAHGVLGSFTNRVCVGDDASRPQFLNEAREFRVALKDDGSRATSPSITAPGGDLPCVGNGDGKWDYVLVQNVAARLRISQR
jgi:hypothetical protein